jgi:hypothetical protein
MYTVFHVVEDGSEMRGLTLPEAFSWVMALAQRNYFFVRLGDEMVLRVKRQKPLPELAFPDPDMDGFFSPKFRSARADNDIARAEIMDAVIRIGIDGYAAIPDEQFDEIAT